MWKPTFIIEILSHQVCYIDFRISYGMKKPAIPSLLLTNQEKVAGNNLRGEALGNEYATFWL